MVIHRKIMSVYGAQNTNEHAVNVYNCVENIVKLGLNGAHKRYAIPTIAIQCTHNEIYSFHFGTKI